MALMQRRVEPMGEFADWFPRRLYDWPDWSTLKGFAEEIKVEEFKEDGTMVIRAELPGIEPDKDIEITVKDDTLRIHAERREEKKEDQKDFYRSEFRYGSFTRILNLPAGASEDDVKASYHDGILEVRVPIVEAKAEATKVSITRT